MCTFKSLEWKRSGEGSFYRIPKYTMIFFTVVSLSICGSFFFIKKLFILKVIQTPSFLFVLSRFDLNLSTWRAGADDKPLRMVKTVLHELVKLRGTAIKGHLSMVPIDMEPQPIILAYIDLNLQVMEINSVLLYLVIYVAVFFLKSTCYYFICAYRPFFYTYFQW